MLQEMRLGVFLGSNWGRMPALLRPLDLRAGEGRTKYLLTNILIFENRNRWVMRVAKVSGVIDNIKGSEAGFYS